MKKILTLALTIGMIVIPIVADALKIPTGRDLSGDLTITSGTTTDNATASNIVALSNSGVASTTVASNAGFAAGQYVMLIQMVGTGAGNFEFQKIQSISGGTLFFYSALTNTYQASGAQVLKVSEYHNVSITGGTWTAASWNGTTGGVLVALLTGGLSVTGTGAVTAPSGFAGGVATNCTQVGGQRPCAQGNSSTGTGSNSTSANGMGGGGGQFDNGANVAAGGGGGGYGGSGTTGNNGGAASVGGTGGGTGGVVTLASLFMGGGGGGGDTNNGGTNAGSGGAGSGIIFISSASTTISGSASITSNGGAGGSVNNASGGGGAGGSIRIPVRLNMTIGSGLITASAGAGGATSVAGGGGGVGRVATVSAASVSGTASPSIDTSSSDFVYNVDNDAIQMSLGSSF